MAKPPEPPLMKPCRARIVCGGLPLPLDAFQRASQGKFGRRSSCARCEYELEKRRRSGKAKETRLKSPRSRRTRCEHIEKTLAADIPCPNPVAPDADTPYCPAHRSLTQTTPAAIDPKIAKKLGTMSRASLLAHATQMASTLRLVAYGIEARSGFVVTRELGPDGKSLVCRATLEQIGLLR